jgi:coronatine-insensitive protein 1
LLCAGNWKRFFVEETTIAENENVEWRREMGTSNVVLETLDFFLTDIRASSEYMGLHSRN